jgi:hypothetical protein
MNRKFLIACLCLANGLLAQPALNRLEYFFDTDPGIGNATAVTITPSTNISELSFSPGIVGLSPGLHYIFVRSRDANGRWSLCAKASVYKMPVVAQGSMPNINRIEYFFNTDPGMGNGITSNISAGQHITNLNIEPYIANLPTGVNWFYIRSRDETGKWSLTAKHLVYKVAPTSITQTQIVQMEYFINTDPGFGNGVPLVFNPADSLANFSFPANIAGLSSGIQTLYIRSKDSEGKWSLSGIDTFTLSHTPPAQAIVVNSLLIPANENPGGSGSAMVQNEAPVLNADPALTVCAGKTIKLAFDPKGNFDGANAFRVELSNQNGSFANAKVIGEISGTSGKEITCQLPRHLTPGSNYKIRVVSNNPSITGDPNRDAITINDINIGNDTTVIVNCINSRINLTTLYKTSGLTTQWNTSPANNAPIGEYRLIVNNSTNCPDTAYASVVLPTAVWTGAISTDWHTAGNWNNGKVPDAATHVIVASTAPNICIIGTADATAASVQLKNGATIQQTNGRLLIILGKCAVLPT